MNEKLTKRPNDDDALLFEDRFKKLMDEERSKYKFVGRFLNF